MWTAGLKVSSSAARLAREIRFPKQYVAGVFWSMPGRLSCRVMGIVVCALLLMSIYPACASGLSAREYLALKKRLSVVTSPLSSVQSNSSSLIGRTIELAGRVEGTMSSSEDTTFILDCDKESFVIRAGAKVDPCISNGNTVRVLARIGPDSVSSLSDLHLEGAAYDYEVASAEQASSAKAVKASGKATPRVLYRGSNPILFPSATNSRGTNISSRAMTVYAPYRAAVKKFNPGLSDEQADVITKSILGYSERYGVDPRLVIALIITESGFRPSATSRSGAMGLCQLMPRTARGMGVSNAYDPEQNIEASVRLIRGHLDKYGDLKLALSAYNAGPGAVKKHGGVPPYRETRNYIEKVSRIFKALCGE